MTKKYESPAQQICYGDVPPEQPEPPMERTFTQTQVDQLMIHKRRKLQEDLASAHAKLKEYEGRPDLESALAQRDGKWQSRLDEAEDGQAKAMSDALTAKEQELATRLSERDAAHVASLADWQGRHGEVESKLSAITQQFHAHKIKHDLLRAASQGNACVPEQVVMLLDRHARVGEDGQVIIQMGDQTLSPSQVIESMRADPAKYGNLFTANTVGGVGGSSGSNLKQGTVNVRNMSPEQYRRLKVENPGLLGLRGGQ